MRWLTRTFKLSVLVLIIIFVTKGTPERKVQAVIVTSDITGSDADGQQLAGILRGLGGHLGTVRVIHQTGLRGDQTSILRAIDNLKQDTADTVLFYYSGHGGTDAGTGEHYFKLDSGERLFRRDVRRALSAHGCRLAVLLSDCCSAFEDTAPTARSVQSVSGSHLESNVKHLFLNFRGLVDLQSCTAPEFAWADEKGGVFTTALARALRGSNLVGANAWEVLRDDVIRFTNLGFREFKAATLSDPSMPETHKSLLADQVKQTPIVLSPLPELAPHQTNTPGVSVISVVPGSAATQIRYNGRAYQLDPGDVIVELGGTPMTRVQDYVDVIDQADPEAEISITVFSNGDRLYGTVELDQGGGYRFGASVRGRSGARADWKWFNE